MSILAVLTGLFIALAFAGVFFSKYDSELIFGFGLLALILIGALPVDKAFSGLSNPGVITLMCLFVVAGGIRTTGGLNAILANLLKPDDSFKRMQMRLLPPIAALSAFFNNTPIVAALIPGVVDWCKRYDISPSKVLLPISYAAILGGTCTIIGTSTNLIVNGLLEAEFPEISLGFFEIAKIGLPITLLGLLYLILFSQFILPTRKNVASSFMNPREYTFEMIVEDSGNLIGQTVEQAGLRGLKGVYLIELIRQGTKIGNVNPNLALEPNDRLIFSGSVSSISDLASIGGLRHPENQVYKMEETINTQILEVIVSASNPLVGQNIKESNFRKLYNSVIIAVIRNGERLDKKTGDIEIQAGDLLLLHAANEFARMHKYSREFLILHGGSDQQALRSSKAIFAWASLFGVVILAAFNVVPIMVAAFMGVILTLASGCLNMTEARQSIDFKVIALIVFAFGFGEAIKYSGLASGLSQSILGLHVYGPFVLLVGVYLMTLILTELVTNNAAAVIAFSLISGIVQDMSLNIIPFAIAIMIAASASFITPLGYQTNLMVYSAGNYRFSDYLRLGLPMSLIVMFVSMLFIPLFWSLTSI